MIVTEWECRGGTAQYSGGFLRDPSGTVMIIDPQDIWRAWVAESQAARANGGTFSIRQFEATPSDVGIPLF